MNEVDAALYLLLEAIDNEGGELSFVETLNYIVSIFPHDRPFSHNNQKYYLCLQKMNDDDLAEIANMKIQWGKFKGRRIADVPFDYLEWLDKNLRLNIDIHRYLESEKIKALRLDEQLEIRAQKAGDPE